MNTKILKMVFLIVSANAFAMDKEGKPPFKLLELPVHFLTGFDKSDHSKQSGTSWKNAMADTYHNLDVTHLISGSLSAVGSSTDALARTYSDDESEPLVSSRVSKIASPSDDKAKNLIWLGYESFICASKEKVLLEIAAVITNDQLTMIAESPSFVIHPSDDDLKKMDLFNAQKHMAFGLFTEVFASKTSIHDAELQMLSFIKRYTPTKKSTLCGYRIDRDREFLNRCMPELIEHMSRRTIDVASTKELVRRWYPQIKYPKNEEVVQHRALTNVKRAIEELRYYQNHLICKKDTDTIS
jgi:oligoribonuclease